MLLVAALGDQEHPESDRQYPDMEVIADAVLVTSIEKVARASLELALKRGATAMAIDKTLAKAVPLGYPYDNQNLDGHARVFEFFGVWPTTT